MDRRQVNDRVAANISQAMTLAATDNPTLPHAADTDSAKPLNRPSIGDDFTLCDLVRAGGALRVSPESFLADVA